jgi:hypothetical protein
MYSEAVACMRHNRVHCSQLSSSHSIIVRICFTLHVYFSFVSLETAIMIIQKQQPRFLSSMTLHRLLIQLTVSLHTF